MLNFVRAELGVPVTEGCISQLLDGIVCFTKVVLRQLFSRKNTKIIDCIVFQVVRAISHMASQAYFW